MSYSQTSDLLRERARLVGEARSICAAADKARRPLSAEDRAGIEARDNRIASIDSQIARASDTNTGRIVAPNREGRSVEDWVRGRFASRYIDTGPAGTFDAEHRGLAERGVEYRVQNVGTATAGGDVVPTDFYAQLTRIQVFNSNILSMSPTFIDTDGGHNLQVPTVGPTYGAAVAVSENATAAAADDTFGQLTLKAFKYEVFVQLSRELIDDSGVDIIGYLASDAGRKLVNKYGSKLVTGAGTTEPQGLMTAATTAVTAASASLTFDNLISLYHAVAPQYRGMGVWVMNDSTVSSVRQLKDSNGRYLLDISTVPGTPDTLWGRAVISDPNVAAIGHSNVSVAFGDPKGYFVRRANGVRFERSDEFAFDKDLVTFRAIVRLDGQLVDTNSFRSLVHA